VARLRPPGGPSITKLDECLNRLRPHERELLKHLVTIREKPGAGLASYGRARSAYSTGRTARAFVVGRISALLESVCDELLGPVKVEKV
jgi:hypothetical protein